MGAWKGNSVRVEQLQNASEQSDNSKLRLFEMTKMEKKGASTLASCFIR